jgi:hypothetical protein
MPPNGRGAETAPYRRAVLNPYRECGVTRLLRLRLDAREADWYSVRGKEIAAVVIAVRAGLEIVGGTGIAMMMAGARSVAGSGGPPG